ncbi:hypothetical protein [Paraburkholderia nemoris]|uniref:hypothetical protein n=1 Tax=Paraburkholderia nemoris TaxID=2793076 RepID=UPI001B0E675B|nr:hypothetical protein [Paraburkholderia nemoris]CAE6748086.1 hypothetical protein LMG22931_03001 [Paraburkholderia nemoris]
MNSHIGEQLVAPDGFHGLSKTIRYYFCGRRSNDGSALLIWFAMHEKQRRVHFVWLPQEQFEEALLQDPPAIVEASRQCTLPEWLSEYEGIAFEDIEDIRYKEKKQTYLQQVEAKFSKVRPLLAHENEILSANDPLKEMARYAPSSANRYRIQVWFFSYILHGRNIWALMRSSQKTGRWNRIDEQHASRKFGRASLADGSRSGWSIAQIDRKKIVDSYLRYCGPGVSMAEIYRRAMVEVWGCKAIKTGGTYQLYHPNGQPFPSYGQYRYHIVCEFGLERVRLTKLGQPRVRRDAKQNEGNFTRPYANLLESVVVDAYYVDDRARSFRSDEPMPALVAACAICETSGANVGIGFSLGSESGEAYRSMLFCMAVPKPYYARLMGIPPECLDWGMEGVPPSFTSDRGPGGSIDLVHALKGAFPIKTIIPSHSGQSNAVAEASHPRSVELDGAPTFKQSDHDVVTLMKREIFRACYENHTKNISDRLSDEAIRHFRQQKLVATPYNLWNYLQKRRRTSGHSLSIEDAVRSFCEPQEFNVNCDGALFNNHVYSSKEFRKSGIQTEAAGLTNFRLSGYILPLAMRYLWVEVKGHLIELEACSRVRIDGADLNVPLSDLESAAKDRAAVNAMTRKSAEAAHIDARGKFEGLTGQSWDAGHRRTGSPRKATGITGREADLLGQKAGGRKRA